MKAVCIFSGGLDSTVAAYQWIASEENEIELLTFNYGQRHQAELESAVMLSYEMGQKIKIVDISDVKMLMKGSSLTDDVEVPDGHYEEESMKSTIVPSRNAIFLSIAWAYATTIQADVVLCGVHAGDHHIYPDCRPDFLVPMSEALSKGTEGHSKKGLRIYAPFLSMSKNVIVEIGHKYNVPFEKTWTCYKGLDDHCGTCGSCVERKEAFIQANVKDPTIYMEA